MHKFIMDAIESTLKDWGVDWKLDSGSDFRRLMEELELALGKVLD